MPRKHPIPDAAVTRKPPSPSKRRLIDASVAIRADAPSEIAFQHTVLCQTCLPYRDPGADVRLWSRSQGGVHLEVEAGRAIDPRSERFVDVGLPFGPKPRLILCHLNAEALRTGSRTVEVRASLSAFAQRIGLAGHGRDLRVIKDQLMRLQLAEIRLAVVYDPAHADQVNMRVVSGFRLWFPKDDRQRVLWPSEIHLDQDYFNSLQRHAVPLDERALTALSHSAMGLDLYAWLAQRLHRIRPGRPQLVSWPALKEQFGFGYRRPRKFREVFMIALREALSAYPGARLEADERGLTLKQSSPPIPRKGFPALGKG
jgi:hypothetical protein